MRPRTPRATPTRIAAATAASLVGIAVCVQETHGDGLNPLAPESLQHSRERRRGRRPARSRLCSCSARTTPARRCRSTKGRGFSKLKLNRSGRLPRAISITSRNPRVAMSPTRAPLRSVMALMTTVAPWAKNSRSAVANLTLTQRRHHSFLEVQAAWYRPWRCGHFRTARCRCRSCSRRDRCTYRPRRSLHEYACSRLRSYSVLRLGPLAPRRRLRETTQHELRVVGLVGRIGDTPGHVSIFRRYLPGPGAG